MRWKTKVENFTQSRRTVRRFAWLPIRLEDGFTVWLTWYYVNQIWRESVQIRGDKFPWGIYGWFDVGTPRQESPKEYTDRLSKRHDNLY